MNPQRFEPQRHKFLVFVGSGLFMLLLVSGMIFARRQMDSIWNRTRTSGPAQLSQKPSSLDDATLNVPDNLPLLAWRLDVEAPQKLLPWIVEAAQPWLKTPLMLGFLHTQAPAWLSKGEELGAAFKGPLASFLLEQLLEGRASVAAFSEQSSASSAPFAPVLVVEEVSAKARASLVAFDTVVSNQTVVVPSCSPTTEAPTLHRWMVAGQPVYFGSSATRVALSTRPLSVWLGLCTEQAAAVASSHAAVMVWRARGTSREAQMATSVLGVSSDEVRFAFDFDGRRLLAAGVDGSVQADRVAAVAVPKLHWQTIPEASPVVLSAAIKLPDTLSDEALAQWFEKPQGRSKIRVVSVVWWPGDTLDVAVVWSDAADLKYLEGSISSRASTRVICEQVVVVSQQQRFADMEQACSQTKPSLLAVNESQKEAVAGPLTLALRVHTGQALSWVMQQELKKRGTSLGLDSVVSNHDANNHHANNPSQSDAKSPATILKEAQLQLEALPSFWFAAESDGDKLRPRKERS